MRAARTVERFAPFQRVAWHAEELAVKPKPQSWLCRTQPHRYAEQGVEDR